MATTKTQLKKPTIAMRIREAVAAGSTGPDDIAAAIGTNKQTVHTALSNMVKKGEIERVAHATYGLVGDESPKPRGRGPGRPPGSRNGNRPTRDRILAALANGMTSPADIGLVVGRKRTSVNSMLLRMRDAGEVVSTGRGQWAVANGSAPVAEVSLPSPLPAVETRPTRATTRDLKHQLRANRLVANALKELYPDGRITATPEELVDWMNITVEMITR